MTAPARTPFDRAAAHGVEEPFRSFNLAGVLDPVDIRSAITIARIFAEEDPDVLLAAALAVRGTRFGHVCIDLATIRETVTVDGVPVDVVDELPWPDPSMWLEAVIASPMTGHGEPERPLVVDGNLLYLERFWNYEQRVIHQILARLPSTGSSSPSAKAVLARLLPGDGAENLQRKAAATAIDGRIAVIAGGPGTGKTYTVARLIAALLEAADKARQPSIAVAAPTGKAAARLTEQIRATAAEVDVSEATRDRMASMEAATLHRLLGWHPIRGRFRHGPDNPLPHDMVIVDEMSMVPLTMTARLLEAIHPDTSVVMVGDPDQLVSIEAGTVLGDLVAAGTPTPAQPSPALAGRVVTLERLFRFERNSPIGDLAEAIRSGNADTAIELLAGGGDGIRWFDPSGKGEATSVDELTGPIVAHARRLISTATTGDANQALESVGQLAVLCAHRRGDHGVQHWGSWIERRARYGTGSYEAWYPGRPVMVLINDYRLGVFNGDIGVTVIRDGVLTVAFPGPDGPRFIGPAQLPAIETVHAMTIHKSQGSQFEEVVVLVPGEESRLLTRELLYTAVTRAEDLVTVVGAEVAIRAAIGRQVTRSSGLSAGLSSHG